jgi:trigger factor
MTTHTLERLPKNTVVLNVTIPWSDIQSEYGSAFDVIHKEFVFEGFRKGKVPKEIAEKHISKDSVYQQLIRTILPTIYDDIVKKEDLKPIISPKIDLTEAKENEDWKIKITLAEKPLIDLGDYKTYVKEAKAETKKDEIWVPGKEPQKEETKDQTYLPIRRFLPDRPNYFLPFS